MSASVNAFQRSAQLTKLEKMLAAIERIERSCGATKQESLAFWRKATEVEWASLAVLSGIRPPKTTKPMLIERLAKRAGVL